MLLDTHSLLITTNEVDWLVTNRTVADMEDKLPREKRLDWERQICTVEGDTRFETISSKTFFSRGNLSWRMLS